MERNPAAPSGCRTMFVFLDFVGTIAFPQPDVTAVYFETGLRFGSHLDRVEIGKRFRELYSLHFLEPRRSAPNGLKTDDGLERGRWFDLVTSLFDDVADATTLFQTLWDHFALPTSWALYPDVGSALANLKRFGLRIGVASNFDSRLLSICRNKPELKPVEWVFLSSVIGWNKPSPRFFEAVAARVSAESHELIMVGDHEVHDYQTPMSSGWTSFHLVREPGHLLASHQIASLAELPNRIERLR